ncbi:MAG: hypothetical protein D6797_08085 [Bdellovibrio sp.]|nr:MAG: hypothetical protein D6797_08085 [Bdellovibrio sp.]
MKKRWFFISILLILSFFSLEIRADSNCQNELLSPPQWIVRALNQVDWTHGLSEKQLSQLVNQVWKETSSHPRGWKRWLQGTRKRDVDELAQKQRLEEELRSLLSEEFDLLNVQPLSSLWSQWSWWFKVVALNGGSVALGGWPWYWPFKEIPLKTPFHKKMQLFLERARKGFYVGLSGMVLWSLSGVLHQAVEYWETHSIQFNLFKSQEERMRALVADWEKPFYEEWLRQEEEEEGVRPDILNRWEDRVRWLLVRAQIREYFSASQKANSTP